ncbi:MAG: hypothetical protein RLZ98_652 [Pseudomonadota bacterium]
MAADFSSRKARKEISGAACGGVELRFDWCLAVNDERRWAQFFSIADGKLVPRETIALLPEEVGDVAYGEIDAEGAAYDDGHFYAVGSHGLSRSSAEYRASQFFVFRFPVNRRTGKPGFSFSRSKVSSRIERSDKLRTLIARAPHVGAFAEKPLDANGVNIEGLAVRTGRMYLGFRGPSLAGNAFIMDVAVSAVFGRREPDTRVHALALGKDTGIRDLARVSDGLLVLAGPVNDQEVAWSIHFWSPDDNRLTKLATLDRDHDGLAETLLVLSEDEARGVTSYEVLVMYDGLRNGRPTRFRLQRR